MPQPELCLPKSHIRVAEGDFVVCSSTNDSEVIARHKLQNISAVAVSKQFEPISIVFGIVGICLTYFPLVYVENQVFRWVVVGLGIACCLLALFGAIGTRLTLSMQGGNMAYTVNDLPEHAEGFAATLREMIGDRPSTVGENVDYQPNVDSAEGRDAVQ